MGLVPTRSARPTAELMAMAAAVPIVATITGTVLLGVWGSQLPDRLATHWGSGGEPDGFLSRSAMFWTILLIGVGFVVVAGVVIRLVDEPRACVYVVAGTAGISAFVMVLLVVSVGVQRGIGDASEARFPGWWAAVAAGVGVIATLATYVATPRWTISAESSESARLRPLPIGPTERVVWTRSVLSGAIMLIPLLIGVLGFTLAAILTDQWWMVGPAVLIGLVAVVFRGMRVTVDPGGLTITSVVRWPRVAIPTSEITAARVVRVSALKDFGGYGYRVGFRGDLKGVKGFVLRSGDGILVDRTGGGREVVVVDDAETAVRLLETYRQRADSAS